MMRSKKEIEALRQKFIDKALLSRDRETMLTDNAWVDALGYVLMIPPAGDSL